jgi:hypothetical protein
MPLTRVQPGLLEATGTPDATTFLRGDGAWSAPVVSALSTATGSAPSYSARAWVNFNGTGTVAIRSSGNVSSITDNGTADYTINFTTAMPDANYSTVGTANLSTANYGLIFNPSYGAVPTTTTFRFSTSAGGTTLFDCLYINAAIFR